MCRNDFHAFEIVGNLSYVFRRRIIRIGISTIFSRMNAQSKRTVSTRNAVCSTSRSRVRGSVYLSPTRGNASNTANSSVSFLQFFSRICRRKLSTATFRKTSITKRATRRKSRLTKKSSNFWTKNPKMNTIHGKQQTNIKENKP